MLQLSRLEEREVPVTFAFDFSADPLFTADARAAVALAGHVVGDRLHATGSNPDTIRVRVGTAELPGRLAEGKGDGAGFGFVTLSSAVNWHTGPTEAGLTPYEVDLFTGASHELFHVLGIGTAPDWAAGALARGIPVAADGFHFAPGVHAVTAADAVKYGRRQLPTAVDFMAAADIGYRPDSLPIEPAISFASVVGPDGRCRLYVVTAAGAFATPYVTPFMFVFEDCDYDGVPDLRVRTPGPGFDAVVSGRTGGVIAAEAVAAPATVLTGRGF